MHQSINQWYTCLDVVGNRRLSLPSYSFIDEKEKNILGSKKNVSMQVNEESKRPRYKETQVDSSHPAYQREKQRKGTSF